MSVAEPALELAAGVARRPIRQRLGPFGAASVLLGLFVLVAYVVLAVVGPLLTPYDPNGLAATPFSPPSHAHWLGTDDLGRDQLSRAISAARVAVIVAAGSVAIGVVCGTLLGATAGYVGGRTDAFLMRLMDVKFAFPDLVLALVIIAALNPGLLPAILAIAFVYIPRFGRIARTATATVRKSAYIEAARLSGTSLPRILLRHVLPNIAPPLIVMTALSIATAQLAYAALAFLGFGARPPQADFGTMLATGRAYMTFDAWLVIVPAACLVAFTVASSLVGDAVRDALDPRMGWDAGEEADERG